MSFPIGASLRSTGRPRVRRPGVGGNRKLCWECWEWEDGARPHDLPTSAGANFPLALSLAVSACEIHAGRPAQQPALQKGDPTLGDLAAPSPAAILTGAALASTTATNSKRIAAAVRLGWLAERQAPEKKHGEMRASRNTSKSFTLASTVWAQDPAPMLRCRR